MLYAARYTIEALTRQEELAHQRALAEKLLAYSLKREHGLELPSLAQSRTAAGKPYFPGCPVEYSLSHCRGLVCCALSLSPVGVDAEAPRTFSPALLHPGGALLAYRPAGPAAGLPLPVDPERERDEALRPGHRLRLPAGVLHLPRGPAPLPGARRAPVPVRPGGGHCCLRRRRGGVPKHPAGGARPVIRSYPAVLSHRYTTRTQQRGTVERWSYR